MVHVSVGPGANDWVYRESCARCGSVIKRKDFWNDAMWSNVQVNTNYYSKFVWPAVPPSTEERVVLCVRCGGGARHPRVPRPQGPGLHLVPQQMLPG
jgi:hypothetical protein